MMYVICGSFVEIRIKKKIFSRKLCNFAVEYSLKYVFIMAIPVTNIPVLTGEVAERFMNHGDRSLVYNFPESPKSPRRNPCLSGFQVG